MVGCTVGIFDALDETPSTAEALAARTGVSAQILPRVLHALRAAGLVRREEERWLLDQDAEVLASRHPQSLEPMVRMCADEGWAAWTNLEPALRSGRPPLSGGRPPFQRFAQDEAAYARFEAQMSRSALRHSAVLAAALPLSGTKHIVDVGGGSGVLAAALVQRTPGAHVTVFDQAFAQAQAEAHLQAQGVSDDTSFVSGDFFEAIPAGGDLYVLSKIIHDWDDEHARTILGNCHRAAGPGARIAVFERLVAETPADSDDVHLADLNVWLMCGGQERTPSQISGLLSAAGFADIETQPIGDRHALVTGRTR